MMDKVLGGRVALVTGGARGIGQAIATAFAAAGASVLITDVLAEAGGAAANAIGGDCAFIEHDVADDASWASAIGAAVTRFGGLDIVVNNAGIERAGMIADMDLAEWRRLMAINFEGVMLGTRHALPVLRDGGSIVNMSSGAALGWGPGMSAYGASKAAVVHFTRSAALEAAPRGIRVNAILPGMTETAMAAQLGDHYTELGFITDAAALRADMLERIPLKRYAAPSEIASVALFLCSDAASYVTGACIPVDGALTLV